MLDYEYSSWNEAEIAAVSMGGHWGDIHEPIYSGWDYTYSLVEVPSAPVPEPASMLLFGTGLVGIAGARLRKKR